MRRVGKVTGRIDLPRSRWNGEGIESGKSRRQFPLIRDSFVEGNTIKMFALPADAISQNSGKWLAVAMKKSIGNESTKFVRDARNAIRACLAISGGGEVLFAAASVVIRITIF